MNRTKPGDRVHVEFEGIVQPDGSHNLQWCTVLVEGSDSKVVVRKASCTVLAPPIKVGDLVTAENLDQLGEGSVAVRPGYAPTWHHDGLWHTCLGSPIPGSMLLNGEDDDLRVLRIGDGRTR
jgi:hypothetical protein